MDTKNPNEKDRTSAETGADLVDMYFRELDAAELRFKDWTDKNKNILKRFRAEHGKGAEHNVLWANYQTMLPAFYSRTPRVNIERRQPKDSDPIARLTSEAWEKATAIDVDDGEFDAVMEASIQDLYLFGRAVGYVKYVAEMGPAYDNGAPILDETGKQLEVVVSERTEGEYVYWEDYRHSAGRCEKEIWWKARRRVMYRDELITNFGEQIGGEVALNYQPKDRNLKDKSEYQQAEVWEVQDLSRRQYVWISDGYKKGPLKQTHDPLGLEKFYSFTPGLYGTMTNDTLVPVQDASYWWPLLQELDKVTAKLNMLVDALKVKGLYNAANKALANLLTDSSDLQMIPCEQFGRDGDIKNAVAYYPIEIVANTLASLRQEKQAIMNDIYDMTGMADILRGSSNPNETATAQQLKGKFATLRLARTQRAVQKYARDLIALRAEIIAKHFQDQTIIDMIGGEYMSPADKEMLPQALQLMRNAKLRQYRIDIETDSTIAIDDEQEKQTRNEFMGAFGNFFSQLMQYAQNDDDFMPVASELLMFAVRGYKAGRSVEGSIEAFLNARRQQIEQAKQQPPEQQPPQPDPALIELQQKAQLSNQQMQIDSQLRQQELNIKSAVAQHAMTIKEREQTLKEKDQADRAQIEMLKIAKAAEAKLAELRSTVTAKANEIQKDMAIEANKLAQNERFETVKQIQQEAAQNPVVAVVG